MCSITTKVLNRRLSSDGMSASKVINKLRIERASDLFVETGLSIKEIARMVEVSEAWALTRAFTRNSGMSPEDWRRTRMAAYVHDETEAVQSAQIATKP